MTRPPITLTAAEWASVQPDGTLWLVREGRRETRSLAPDEYGERVHGIDLPPEGWLAYASTCSSPDHFGCVAAGHPCPDCRIELVGPCLNLAHCMNGEDDCWCTPETAHTVTLGHAYAIGQPLLIARAVPNGEYIRLTPDNRLQHVRRVGVMWELVADITAALAHYGPPETLVARWALQLRAVQ